MAFVRIRTEIRAPVERVFDLARDIDLHVASMRRHGETAVGGVTAGLIGEGQEVRWRARHLGRTFELTARITALQRPSYFRDVQVIGPFARFVHDHRFEPVEGGTAMADLVEYRAPFGVVGRLVDAVVLRRHLRRLLHDRAAAIKAAAESDRH
jgi:ligand-binding SRPBCC domain-containing protein